MTGPKPPIDATPGDLLMVLRIGVAELERIKAESPDDSAAIDGTADAVKVALDYWIELRTHRRGAVAW